MNYHDSMFIENDYIKTETGVINTYNKTYYTIRRQYDVPEPVAAFALPLSDMNLIRKHSIPTIVIRFISVDSDGEEVHTFYRSTVHHIAALPIERFNSVLCHIVPINELQVLGREVKSDTRLRC